MCFHFLQCRWAEKFPKLQALVPFCLESLQFISLLLYFTISNKEKPDHTFNILLRNLLIQISKFETWNFYFPQNTRTQFNQVLCQFITRITFLLVSSNMFYLFIWDLPRITFNIHSSTNIVFTICVFSKTIAAFFRVLLFFPEPSPELPSTSYFYQ